MKWYDPCYRFLGRWIEGKEKKMDGDRYESGVRVVLKISKIRKNFFCFFKGRVNIFINLRIP